LASCHASPFWFVASSVPYDAHSLCTILPVLSVTPPNLLILTGPTVAQLSALTTLVSSLPARPTMDFHSAYLTSDLASSDFPSAPPHLNYKTLRRILVTRESIFKYGIHLPRSDRDADSSPESA
jgi:hypothetical protein